MRRLHRRRGLTVALVTMAVLLAACGGGDDDEDSTRNTRPPKTTTTTEATTTSETVPPPAPPIAPLTGLLTDPSVLARPVLAAKIDNVSRAHPQVGINQADVVYEEVVEGSVTRLMALFHSTDSAPIGPIRSARSTDIGLFSPLNRPLFAWSGANGWVTDQVQAANIVDVGHSAASDQYYRDRSRRGPHNLFINGYDAMLFSHLADAGTPPALFQYRAPTDPLGAGAQPISSVHIVFGTLPGNAPVDYVWDPLFAGGWARSQSGRPHVDANGVQVAPQNVVIQFTDYVDLGAGILEGQTVGAGFAWVLTNGHLIGAGWSKPTPEGVTQYVDSTGAPIKLTPGRTWVALAPPGSVTVA